MRTVDGCEERSQEDLAGSDLELRTALATCKPTEPSERCMTAFVNRGKTTSFRQIRDDGMFKL